MSSSVVLLTCLIVTSLFAAFTCQGYQRFDEAGNVFNQVSDVIHHVDEVVDDQSHDVMMLPGNKDDEISLRQGCHCNDRTGCVCCESRRYFFYRAKLDACMRMSLLPTGGAYLIFELNKRHVFAHPVIMNNLPRPCAKVPKLPGILTKSWICLDFYHVNVATGFVCTHITGYIKLGWHTKNVYAKLGCVTLPRPKADAPEMALESLRFDTLADLDMSRDKDPNNVGSLTEDLVDEEMDRTD